VERKAAASTVNLALASLDALYRCLALGGRTCGARSPRRPRPGRWTRPGSGGCCAPPEAAPVRARALVMLMLMLMLMLFTALRISETVALDVDDVRITARKGVLTVFGKGETRREVPLNALVRQVLLDEWLEQRKELANADERACGSAGPVGGCRPARPSATCAPSPLRQGLSCRRTRCGTRA
jgi:integrase